MVTSSTTHSMNVSSSIRRSIILAISSHREYIYLNDPINIGKVQTTSSHIRTEQAGLFLLELRRSRKRAKKGIRNHSKYKFAWSVFVVLEAQEGEYPVSFDGNTHRRNEPNKITIEKVSCTSLQAFIKTNILDLR